MNKRLKINFYKKLTFLVIILGIIIRFSLASIYSVSGDACWQFSAARFLAENKKFPLLEPLGRLEPFWAPPLFHILASSLFLLFGNFGFAEFGMKMLSPLFGSLTLIIVYLISKKLFNEKITFYSMIFTAFIPMFMDYGTISYIDSTLTFFVVLSIYFALSDKYIKSSIVAGLAAITKYDGVFILPLLIYITYNNTKDKKLLIKKLFLIVVIPILIVTPWLLRNYAEFGNPFWPFVNFEFITKGVVKSGLEHADAGTFKTFEPLKIFSTNTITFTYLAIFGVPEGNYNNIFFFDVPYVQLIFILWFLATLFFILPFAKSLSREYKSTNKILLLWIFSYLAVVLIYISNVSYNAARFFLPAIPALGMLYGIGINRLNFKNINVKNIFFILVFIIIIGFVMTEVVKISLAAKEWDFYKDDFSWVNQNTDKDSLIIPGIQCLSYYLNRGTLEPKPENINKADYVWVNKNFKLEKSAIVTDEILEHMDKNKNDFELVYENKKTSTSIYKVKR